MNFFFQIENKIERHLNSKFKLHDKSIDSYSGGQTTYFEYDGGMVEFTSEIAGDWNEYRVEIIINRRDVTLSCRLEDLQDFNVFYNMDKSLYTTIDLKTDKLPYSHNYDIIRHKDKIDRLLDEVLVQIDELINL